MARKCADYIYKNSDDTIRFKIFKRYSTEHITDDDNYKEFIEWDVDIFEKENDHQWTYSTEYGDLFRTKKQAKSWIEQDYNKVSSFVPIETCTEGW